MVGNVSLSASSGYGQQPTWRQARAEIREEANTNTVAEALEPELEQDDDGIVEVKFGTALWDYGQAVKNHTHDARPVNEIVQEIAKDNPFITDVDELPAGEDLDLSRYVVGQDEEGSSRSGRHHRSGGSGSGLLGPGQGQGSGMPGQCFPPIQMPQRQGSPLGSGSGSGSGQGNCLPSSGGNGNGSSNGGEGGLLINTNQTSYFGPENQFFSQTTTTLIDVPTAS